MAGFNYAKAVKTADKLIAKFGPPSLGFLRRDGNDRPCTIVMTEYSWRERSLRLEGAVRFLISTLDPITKAPLDVPPDHEEDQVVFAGKVYRLATKDEGLRPGGTIVFHDFQGLYDQLDTATS